MKAKEKELESAVGNIICYKLQQRPNNSSMLLHIGRLLQQFVVDMYIKVET